MSVSVADLLWLATEEVYTTTSRERAHAYANKSVKYAILPFAQFSLPVSLISAADFCCFRKLTSTGIEIVGVLGRARLQVSRIQGFV